MGLTAFWILLLLENHGMKLFTAILFYTATIQAAETNVVSVVVTNRVRAVEWYRDVDGKLYNTQKSQVWHLISGKVATAENGGLIVELQDQNIFLKNYSAKIADGKPVNVRAMEAGVTNVEGFTLHVWDCGTPHFVSMVKTNFVPVIID
jgi:hypothetical protein